MFSISLLEAHCKILLPVVFAIMVMDSRDYPVPVELGGGSGAEVPHCVCSPAAAHGRC